MLTFSGHKTTPKAAAAAAVQFVVTRAATNVRKCPLRHLAHPNVINYITLAVMVHPLNHGGGGLKSF